MSPRPTPSLAAVGVWLSPLVLAVLAGSVAAGDAAAPGLVACATIAPLAPLLLTPALRERLLAPGPADLVLLAGLTLVLAANFVVVGDLARLLGLTGAHGLVASAAIGFAVIAWRGHDVWWAGASALGVAAVVGAITLAVMAAGPPWTVWTALASRPALTFDARSAWVAQGRAVGERTSLTFSESHRVVAVTASTWRVTDDWPVQGAVRDWRVNAGDALTFRPGDQLTLERGARVRFEAGRRVPAAPVSGVAWADGRSQLPIARLLAVLSVAVTLVAGGLALAPPVSFSRWTSVGVPVATGAFVVAGTLWGLYGIAIVPELALVPRALAPIAEALERIAGPVWDGALVAGLAVSATALLAGMLLTWRLRLMDLLRSAAVSMGRPEAPVGTLTIAAAALVVAAAAIGLRDDDPWNLFSLGLGIITAGAVAPRLAATGPRAELAGALAGLVVFAAVALDGSRWPGAVLLTHHPVLAAAPAAWLVAYLAGRTAR